MRDLPSGRLTILFTDIEGSTALLRLLGDRYPDVLADHFDALRQAIGANGGTAVRTEGDAVLAVFERAHDAVAACVEGQRRLLETTWPEGVDVRVRMGLHTGEVSIHAGDYVGLAVHQAARIVSAAHGGQILCSAVAAAGAASNLPSGAALVSLGAYAVRDFDRPETLFQVVAPGLERQFPAVRAPAAVAHNLPTIRTGFIGRDRELEAVDKLLATHRLVTITGPGGVGKTRLAFEVARRQASGYADGASVVLLASVTAEDVDAAVASAIGVRPEPGRPLRETLVASLARRQLLLILDNCEQVVDAVATLLNGVLDVAADLAIVATTRQPLEVRGEAVYPLRPLDVPDPSAGAEALAQADAVRLFVDRAVASSGSFRFDHDTAPVVATICRQLDGLPLAVELAAARVRSMPLDVLSARLESTTSVLGTGPRDAETRQRTTGALVQWSVDLLSPEEQLLFRRLSVFRGGFDLAAAERVGGQPPIHRSAVVDLLDALVRHNLVMFDENDRYRMLVIVRELAGEQLTAAGEERVARDAHLHHYADRVVAAGLPSVRLEVDVDNIRAAIAWGLEGQGSAADAMRLAFHVHSYWQGRGAAAEVDRWIDLMPETQDPVDAFRLRLLHLERRAGERLRHGPELVADADALGVPILRLRVRLGLYEEAERAGEYERAGRYAEDGLAVAEELGDRGHQATFLLARAGIAYRLGRLDEASELAEEGVRRAAGTAHHQTLAGLEYMIAIIAMVAGDFAAAGAHLDSALAEYDAAGFTVGRLDVLALASTLESYEGSLDRALVSTEDAMTAARRVGDRNREANAIFNLGHTLYLLGRHDDADEKAVEADRLARDIGDPRVIALASILRAEVAFSRGGIEAADSHLRAVDALTAELGTPAIRGAWFTTSAKVAILRDGGDAAIDMATAASEMVPGDAQGVALLALARRVAGDAAGATVTVTQSLGLDRPLVTSLPLYATYVALAIGDERAVLLAERARAAARSLRIALEQPFETMLDGLPGWSESAPTPPAPDRRAALVALLDALAGLADDLPHG